VIDTILFDLDGTLLPLDEADFIERYFASIGALASPLGLSVATLQQQIWAGTKAILNTTGTMTNAEVFWEVFSRGIQRNRSEVETLFLEYYRTGFEAVRPSTRPNPLAKPLIDFLKTKRVRLILATNPVFPAIATQKRMSWIGLDFSDFSHVTTYENACFAKPNINYYRALLDQFSLDPQTCMMVGNDVDEDMVAEELGIHPYLVTDCLNNRNQKDIDVYPHGRFQDLYVELLASYRER